MNAHASRRLAGLAALLALGLIAGCMATATPIKTLLDDPSRYDGKTVRISGTVESAAASGSCRSGWPSRLRSEEPRCKRRAIGVQWCP